MAFRLCRFFFQSIFQILIIEILLTDQCFAFAYEPLTSAVLYVTTKQSNSKVGQNHKRLQFFLLLLFKTYL